MPISIPHLCNNTIDLDYWKAPSRRFYIANLADFKEVQKVVGKKLKRKHTLTAEKKVKSTYEEMSRSIEMVFSSKYFSVC